MEDIIKNDKKRIDSLEIIGNKKLNKIVIEAMRKAYSENPSLRAAMKKDGLIKEKKMGHTTQKEGAMVKITERGWTGHFCCSHDCLFHRNTLIEGEKDSVVVSTVGVMRRNGKVEEIGFNYYYETMAFGTKKDGAYIEADVSNKRSFESEWCICSDSVEALPEDVDNKANEMHDAVVTEFANRLASLLDKERE